MRGKNGELVDRISEAISGTWRQEDRLLAEILSEAEEEVKASLKSALKVAMLRALSDRVERPRSRIVTPTASGGGNPLQDPPRHEERPPTFNGDGGSQQSAASGQTVEEVPGPQDDQACYVYGVVRAGADWKQLNALQKADPALKLQAVRHQDLETLIRHAPVEEFAGARLESNLADVDWVEGMVRAHDRVLQAAHAAGPLVPLRFGTVLRSDEEVRRLLRDRYDHLQQLLDDFDGKQEWGLKVFADHVALADHVTRADRRVQVLDAEIGDSGRGKAYLLEKERDALVSTEVRRTAAEYAQRCHAQLSQRAARAAVLPAQSRGMADDLGPTTIHAAYLVEEACCADFHILIKKLAQEHDPMGLTLAVTGPWPPYTFVDSEAFSNG